MSNLCILAFSDVCLHHWTVIPGVVKEDITFFVKGPVDWEEILVSSWSTWYAGMKARHSCWMSWTPCLGHYMSSGKWQGTQWFYFHFSDIILIVCLLVVLHWKWKWVYFLVFARHSWISSVLLLFIWSLSYDIFQMPWTIDLVDLFGVLKVISAFRCVHAVLELPVTFVMSVCLSTCISAALSFDIKDFCENLLRKFTG